MLHQRWTNGNPYVYEYFDILYYIFHDFYFTVRFYLHYNHHAAERVGK